MTPLATLDELRSLLQGPGKDGDQVDLGARTRAALAAMIDQPQQAAVHSIAELSEWLGVNPSTLTRLAKKLGYGGFSEFQDVFRRAITDDVHHFYSRQASRLFQPEMAAVESLGVMATLAREATANIAGMLERLDHTALEAAAEKLATAHRVRTYGLRQFYSFACFVGYALGMLRSDVALLEGPRHGVADAIAQLDAGDVLVVASCQPYTRSTVATARVAASHGLSVIAITDSYGSPLVPIAAHSLFVPHASSFYSNSMAAFTVTAEGLLTLVARRLGDKALAALEHREALIAEMNVAL